MNSPKSTTPEQKKKRKKRKFKKKKAKHKLRFTRPFPRVPLEEAVKVATALKEKNGGNPWPPEDVAPALGTSKKNNNFFYITAASRDYGLTEGTRAAKSISLTVMGRSLVYASDQENEDLLRRKAFLNVDIFGKVLEYYNGNNLPDTKFLGNTLQKEFGLDPSLHEDFARLFKLNCQFAKIGNELSANRTAKKSETNRAAEIDSGKSSSSVVILAEPAKKTNGHCFVIMPFRERTESYSPGFFDEVLKSLITPAAWSAGFTVTTAKRQGSDVIQSTIVNELLSADLVVADLTEHNPNVLFELGMRMAVDKPISLVRAEGTGKIFDVDNMLRVYDYNSNLWPSTIERDLKEMTNHIEASWKNRDTAETFMQILSKDPINKAV